MNILYVIHQASLLVVLLKLYYEVANGSILKLLGLSHDFLRHLFVQKKLQDLIGKMIAVILKHMVLIRRKTWLNFLKKIKELLF